MRSSGAWTGSKTCCPSVSRLLSRLGLEHHDGFNFDQQLRPAQNRLDARGGRQRVETLFLVKCRPLFVKGGVIALDVPEVARGPDDVLPGRSLGFQHPRDVVAGSPAVRPEIACGKAPAGP